MAESYPQFNFRPKGRPVRSISTARLDLFDTTPQYKAFNLNKVLDHDRTDEGIEISVWSAPEVSRPLFSEAVNKTFTTTVKGSTFTPSWSTHWFKVKFTIPEQWKTSNYKDIQFEFDCECEGMVYTAEGDPLQGLTGGDKIDRRYEFRIPESLIAERKGSFMVEVGLNDRGGNSVGEHSGHEPPINRVFTLRRADLVAANTEARALAVDFSIIKECAKRLPQESWESNMALNVANEIMNNFKLGSQESIFKCRNIAQKFLGQKIDSHQVYDDNRPTLVTAIGNCHIDTAWLWPYDETKRKAARSWSTQLDLMERYPEYIFCASQAQQFYWIQQDYPSLFKRISKAIQKGSFEVIGGAWVEMDANLPSGEAIARQFLFGQRYFEKEFNKLCKVFWLPDTFGYCSQMPQLCRLAGMSYGFTQKLTYNINDFPHTTFNWVSLDGTQLLMHMAPSNTYQGQCTVDEVVRSVSDHKSLHSTHDSLLLFGNGDGGGGPLAVMLERLRRIRGVSDTVGGLPRVSIGKQSVEQFFDNLVTDSDAGQNLCSWSGELYLEIHRATLTTESNTKKNNRNTEILLHDIELLATLASIYIKEYKYPKQELNELWQKVLLNQFHDVLPGTSIEMVYEDVDRLYEQVYIAGEQIYRSACHALGLKIVENIKTGVSVLNLLPWPRVTVVSGQLAKGTGSLLSFTENVGQSSVSLKEESPGEIFAMENKRYKVTVDRGLIVSLFDKQASRELVDNDRPAGQFVIYDDDKALYWQAWDTELYSLDTRRELKITRSYIATDVNNPNEVGVTVESAISEFSSLKATIRLAADSEFIQYDCFVNWNEPEIKFLKVEFPFRLISARASYESQFGVTERPTHFNTSWDHAKFEVCCHKWADLSEHGYGVAILNDCKYGFATHGNCMRLSLLRSSKEPNGNSDMGCHEFKFAIMPHMGPLDERVVRAAREFNSPVRLVQGYHSALDSISIVGNKSIIFGFRQTSRR